jgi:hypothetical protein
MTEREKVRDKEKCLKENKAKGKKKRKEKERK